ncbi:hypothetical protein DPMN_021120 [Dreissena polymorpha]|uniref:Uncharacterized protein n=1 Tax=Dreissena polymorpha TaxID=45954 RepID=A0A9D4NMD3_DREPO|nr:hypothetical protein DPMN_021120 [Dreissena polymorpha]
MNLNPSSYTETNLKGPKASKCQTAIPFVVKSLVLPNLDNPVEQVAREPHSPHDYTSGHHDLSCSPCLECDSLVII